MVLVRLRLALARCLWCSPARLVVLLLAVLLLSGCFVAASASLEPTATATATAGAVPQAVAPTPVPDAEAPKAGVRRWPGLSFELPEPRTEPVLAARPAGPSRAVDPPVPRPAEAARPIPANPLNAADPTTAVMVPKPTATPVARFSPNDPPSVVVPVLMYHYVRLNPDPRDTLGVSLSIAPADFELQMAALARDGYTVVDLADVQAALRGERQLPARPVVLTFDDGYRDFYEAALPVLRRYRFPATVFVVTGFIDRSGYLTLAMVREIARSGLIRIGSHTLDHADLTAVSSDRLRAELVESRRILEAATGGSVDYFCYPGGKFNAGVARAVEAAGYELAFTTQHGSRLQWSERFALPRVRVDGRENLATFARKVRDAAAVR